MAGLLGAIGDLINGTKRNGGLLAVDELQAPMERPVNTGGLLGGGFEQQQTQQTNAPLNIFGLSDGAKQAFGQLADIIGGYGMNPMEFNQAQYMRAQADELRRKANQQTLPFSGDGFDNQLVQQRARDYIKAGVPADEAFSRAANDVLATKQQFVPDPANPGQMIPVGRSSLAPIGGTTSPQPSTPQASPSGQMTLAGPDGEPAMPVGGTRLEPPPERGMPARGFNPANVNPYNPQSGKAALEADVAASTKGAVLGVEKAAETPKAEASLKTTIQELDNILKKGEAIIGDVGPTTAGIGGAIMSMIPGSKAVDLEENIKTLEANAFISTLAEIRKNSPTGGAVGNVSDSEGEKLAKKYASLQQRQSPEALRKNIAEFNEQMKQTRQRLLEAFKSDFGYIPESVGGGVQTDDPLGLRRR